MQILFNLYGVNMDPKAWEEPLKWNPDRFAADAKKVDWVRDMRLMPFGGGKRMCQGITQVFYVVPMQIATYLLHFEWTEPPLTPEERSAAEDTKILTTHKLHPLKAIGKPRVGSPLRFL
jgi:cytochrome P450